MTRPPVSLQTPAMRSCRRLGLPPFGSRGKPGRFDLLVRGILLPFVACAVLVLFAITARASDERERSPLAHAESRREIGGVQDLAPGRIADRAAGARLLPMRLAEARQAGAANPVSGASIGVVYPDLGEPYRSIFAAIVDGIESKARMPIYSYPVGSNVERGKLESQLRHDGVKVVIALGRQGLKAASTLDATMPVVVGGVLAVPDMESPNMLSISLTPDPALLFAHLKSLVPGVRRVLVVYNPRDNDWLIKLAREAAKAQGLELVAYEAHDLATAARLYQAAFAASDARRDAVWLPQDATTVDESTILPLVLRESWNRSVPVFSSSFLHVKKGALFALYPNNLELGKTLASTAQDMLSGEAGRRRLLPLRDVQIAVNLRTASHIGLNIGYQQQRNFDFIFPEP